MPVGCVTVMKTFRPALDGSCVQAVLRTKTCVSQFVQEQHMSSVGAAISALSVLDMLHQAAGCMIV